MYELIIPHFSAEEMKLVLELSTHPIDDLRQTDRTLGYVISNPAINCGFFVNSGYVKWCSVKPTKTKIVHHF